MSARLLLSILLFSLNIVCFGQSGSGSVSGTVTSVDNEPLEMVSVSLPELKKTTLTDTKGNFRFSNITPGKYIVRIQMIGYKQKDIPVEVIPEQEALVDFKLTEENIHALQEITIFGNVNKFSRKESGFVARLPLKNLENPQVYTTVTKALVAEQMAVDLGSVSKNVPGAGVPMIANQGRVTFRSRGFETEPNARNGVAGAAFSVIDPANLERLEVIKGPSTTLFGTSISSSYGGLYNRVTKKPYNAFGGEVAYFGGS